jgi:hypothetical protein
VRRDLPGGRPGTGHVNGRRSGGGGRGRTSEDKSRRLRPSRAPTSDGDDGEAPRRRRRRDESGGRVGRCRRWRRPGRGALLGGPLPMGGRRCAPFSSMEKLVPSSLRFTFISSPSLSLSLLLKSLEMRKKSRPSSMIYLDARVCRSTPWLPRQ